MLTLLSTAETNSQAGYMPLWIQVPVGVLCIGMAFFVWLNPRNIVVGGLSRFQAFWRRTQVDSLDGLCLHHPNCSVGASSLSSH
jgi:hypothetical protein